MAARSPSSVNVGGRRTSTTATSADGSFSARTSDGSLSTAATISKSLARSRRVSPSRSRAWSSASTTRMLPLLSVIDSRSSLSRLNPLSLGAGELAGHVHRHNRGPAFGAGQRHRAVEGRESSHHVTNPRAALDVSSTLPVVAHLDVQHTLGMAHRDPGALGAGVLPDVGEALRHGAVDR